MAGESERERYPRNIKCAVECDDGDNDYCICAQKDALAAGDGVEGAALSGQLVAAKFLRERCFVDYEACWGLAGELLDQALVAQRQQLEELIAFGDQQIKGLNCALSRAEAQLSAAQAALGAARDFVARVEWEDGAPVAVEQVKMWPALTRLNAALSHLDAMTKGASDAG